MIPEQYNREQQAAERLALAAESWWDDGDGNPDLWEDLISAARQFVAVIDCEPDSPTNGGE